LTLFGAGALGLLKSAPAEASVARGLTLRELVTRSTSVLQVTPVAKRSSWQTIGGTRRIVTEWRARVDDLVSGQDPSASEVLVRTLGGSVGSLGQLVEGEAELAIGQPSFTFVTELEPSLFGVTAMGQGHYPIATEQRGRILRTNRQLPALLGGKDGAVATLRDRLVVDAVGLVRAERP
jgi:hypothetical protein